MKGFNYKKTVQALNYIASKHGGAVNKMKAIKLVWLADRLHLRNYGRTITGDTYFAFKFGPVPSSTRDLLEEASSFLTEEETKYSSQFILVKNKLEYASLEAPQLKVFSETDIDAINKVIKAYGNLDQFQLSELSHDFPEWKKWQSALENKMGTRFQMEFDDFFQNTEHVSPLFNDDEQTLQLVKDLYHRKDSASE